jgi:hypothetical protein
VFTKFRSAEIIYLRFYPTHHIQYIIQMVELDMCQINGSGKLILVLVGSARLEPPPPSPAGPAAPNDASFATGSPGIPIRLEKCVYNYIHH